MMWRAIAASVAIALGLAVGPATSVAAGTAPASTAPHGRAVATAPHGRAVAATLRAPLQRVLDRVNAQRAKRDLRPLRATACLTGKVAQPWARHMADTEAMVHQDLSVVFEKCSGLHRAGENIAYGYPTAAAVMKAWMHSTGHRRNILNKRFTKIGLGMARSADGTPYWVQDFGG